MHFLKVYFLIFLEHLNLSPNNYYIETCIENRTEKLIELLLYYCYSII
jgi:hypothetical protein